VSVPATPHDLCSVEIVFVHDAAFPYVPALQVQAATAELAVGELELLGHATHVVATVAPAVAEYVPARQFVQRLAVLAPAVSEYVPARQFVQTLAVLAPTVAEYVPARQLVQTLAVLAAAVAEYVPARQSVHTALPVAFLYLPATHEVHVPPFGPVKPVLHTQAPTAELSGKGAQEPSGHATQVCAVVAPVAVEYDPGAQLLHNPLLMVGLYLPAGHAVHVEPAGPM